MPILNIPRTARPSYKSGYARSAGESANPGSWRRLQGGWFTVLGPTGTVLRDISGFQNHGSFSNLDGSNWQMGSNPRLPGHTIDFDDASNMVDVGNSSRFNIFGDMTICTTVYHDASAGPDNIVSKGDGFALSTPWQLRVSGGDRIHWEHNDGSAGASADVKTGTGVMTLGVWHQVVAIRWGTNLGAIWMDGIEVVAPSAYDVTRTPTGNSKSVIIGNDPDNLGPWDGKISRVLIYDRAFTSSEVVADYADEYALLRRKPLVVSIPAAAPSGRIMSSLVGAGGLAGSGGIAGSGGGLAG